MSEAQETSASTEILPVLLVNIEDMQLIFPDIAVAEIIDYQSVSQQFEDTPEWYLGELEWRGLTLPLVSLESMSHGAFFSNRMQLKIIVMNASFGMQESGYWAFVALETPKMQRISADAIVPESIEQESEIALMGAELVGEPVIIPDVEGIEKRISALRA